MSLKILHVTNFNFRFDGRLFYNTGKRINNGFIKLDHSVLEFSDRDIIHDNKKIVDLDGSVYLNSKLIRVCDNFKPDLIILGHADKISKNTIKLIKKKHSNIKFSQWFLDPLSIKGPDFIKNKDRFMHKYDFMDANFVTTSPDALSFLPNKDKCLFIPNPSDAALDNLKIYNNFCPNDVFFAMSHGVHRGVLKKGKSDERNIFLNKLTKKKDIIFDFYGHKSIQPIWADNFLNIISKSKMGLNLSRGEPQKYYSSDRIAQFMGNGLVTLIDERTQYQDFFNNNEVVFYKNINDLTEKIIRIKKDDKLRKKIGYNGRKKYIKYFNSARVASFIINKTLGLKTNETFLWE
jgi:spore maturation protein CgeB